MGKIVGNIESLKLAWERYENVGIAKATTEKKAFDEWSKKNPIADMKLDQYSSLLSKEVSDYFTNWMERKTEGCGKFRTGSSYDYGIYRVNQAGDALYMTSIQRGKTKDKKPFEQPEAVEFFNKEIKPLIQEVINLTDMPDGVSLLGINYARKIAYMYNPGQLLPIFKGEVIESIADYFGIGTEIDISDYKATEKILSALCQEWKLGVPNFELTQKLGAFLYENFGKGFSLQHKNIIFYGAPGTGKTYTVFEGIKQRILIDGDDKDDVLDIAQFHPSYSYEDFIEGFKPVPSNGSISLVLKSGRFKLLCKKAMANLKAARSNPHSEKNPSGTKLKNYYFIADEINRAELSRVLGEVLVCLEESNRVDFDKNGDLTQGIYLKSQYGHLDTDTEAVLTMNKEHYFGVPSNLYFIGTMNDIDRSIDSFDLALRRRFVWKRMDCDYSVIKERMAAKNSDNIDEYVEICKSLNRLISQTWRLGSSYEIGHAYYLGMEKVSKGSIKNLFETKIGPLLAEYLRAEYDLSEIEAKLKEAEKIFSFDQEPSNKKVTAQTSVQTVGSDD
jgi:hypothetical protein